MAQDFDPLRLDVQRFAEDGGAIDAATPVRSLQRLRAETEGGDARTVQWRARGELRNPRHIAPEVWVHLEAEAALPLVCQRCLGPVEVKVGFERSFRFVADEATAAAQDDAAEEEVLALSRSFDLVELVEDELLMDLPVAPRHETCPQPVKMSVSDADFEAAEAARENPFAVLGRLKPGKPGSR
jgi:uncharacterized protein